MISISIAIASLIGVLFSPCRKILTHIIGVPLLQTLPGYQLGIHIALIDYVLLPALFYLLLRLFKIDLRTNSYKERTWMLTTGNTLIIGYVLARIIASTIQGGGASFVVASFSRFILIPGLVLISIGIILIIKGFVKEAGECKISNTLNKQEISIALLAIVIPLAFNATLYIGSNSLVVKARRADAIFNELSKISGEKLIAKPVPGQDRIYLDVDGEPYFMNIVNGIHGAYGSGVFSPALLNRELLNFVEVKNTRPNENNSKKYKLLNRNDLWKGAPNDVLSSKYGLFAKNMVSDEGKKLGLKGQEFKIVDLSTNEIIATTTFFVNTLNRRFSGHVTDGKFGLLDFVAHALNLKLKPKPKAKVKDNLNLRQMVKPDK